MKTLPRNDTIRFTTKAGDGSLSIKGFAAYQVPRVQTAVLGSVTASGLTGQFILVGPSLEGGKLTRFFISNQTDHEWVIATRIALQTLYQEDIRPGNPPSSSPRRARRLFDEALRWFYCWARRQVLPEPPEISYAPNSYFRKNVTKNSRRTRRKMTALRRSVSAGQAFNLNPAAVSGRPKA